MRPGADAYARTAQAGVGPRDLEAMLLLRAASRLQCVAEDWTNRRSDLDAALTYNRKLWTILAAAATDPDGSLPTSIQASIASLALFIFNRTIDLLLEPSAERLGVLVSINREIAAGLRMVPPRDGAQA